MWNDMENMEERQLKYEMIWKICKKGKLKWKWYGKYGRIASRIVKSFGKHSRKIWKDMKYMEEK